MISERGGRCVRPGESVQEMLDAGVATECATVQGLTDAIRHCAEVGDFTTRRMFEEMVTEEEQQVDRFETQFETVRQVGMERYLAQQIH